jgi:phosphoserine phosphatase RsbU/P
MAESGPRLKLREASGSESIIPLNKDDFKIGRHGENDLKIRDPFVSRVHAEIIRDGSQFRVHDCESKSGTYVNGERIRSQTLNHGDRIQLSHNEFPELVFLTSGEDVAAEPFLSSVYATSFFATSSSAGDLQNVSRFLESVRQFSAGVPLHEILDVVLDNALEITRSERGFIVLLDDSKQPRFQRGRNSKKEHLNENDFRISSTILKQVLESGTKRTMTASKQDSIPQAESIAALELRTVVCLPLRQIHGTEVSGVFDLKSGVIGALYLDSRQATGALSTISEGLLETLANDVSAVLMNAKLLREAREKERLELELSTAREIQESLLPEIGGTYGTYQAAAQNIPSRRISGDYFDRIQLSGDRTVFVIADVSGKGVSAAILTSLVQGILFIEISRLENLTEAIGNVNRFLVQRSNLGKFVSLFIAVLDPDGKLSYVNAGHNPPFLILQSGDSTELVAKGMVLGVVEQAAFEERTVELHSGDVICLYTDGVTEAHSPQRELFGENRLRETLIRHRNLDAENILENVLQTVTDHTADLPRSDDLTLLIVKYI